MCRCLLDLDSIAAQQDLSHSSHDIPPRTAKRWLCRCLLANSLVKQRAQPVRVHLWWNSQRRADTEDSCRLLPCKRCFACKGNSHCQRWPWRVQWTGFRRTLRSLLSRICQLTASMYRQDSLCIFFHPCHPDTVLLGTTRMCLAYFETCLNHMMNRH